MIKMTKTKKIICAVLVLAVITSAGAYAFSVITANESQKNIQFVQDHVFTVGQYFLMGKYQEEPILWRCIDNTDENGMLMISDKVLCH